ncbi:MAG: sigma-70 family RNA polymerase sigma factor [Alphaproteobacteria bacterium]|nr:sigma-70 family RNA polymerase sigma factor [Alphaproteobacteria bacterium]
MSSGKELVLVNKKSQLPMVVEETGLYSYLEQIKQFPVLTEEEEKNLIYDFQINGNLASAQKLITSHLRLAAKIALTYRRYGLPMSDVISEANLGLMQAVKKFDMNKKVRLATYAIWWIKAQVNDYILRSWSLVKIGTVAAQKKLFYNLSRIKARLGLYENKELAPTVVKQIAKELMVDEQDVTEMNRRIGGDTSLNVNVSDDEDSVEKIDMLVDKRENIEDRFASKEEHLYRAKILSKCLLKLDEREQFIIKNRMLKENPYTLDDIGEKLNISRERVRQIEKRAFEKLSFEVKKSMAA